MKILQIQAPKISPEMYAALQAPFPAEAYSSIESKSYLTTLKAYYVTERLNQVFGPGRWTVEHRPADTVNKKMVMKIGRLVILDYDVEIPEVYGGHEIMDKSADEVDANKSAVTDIISKSASFLGVGADMFKGLVTGSGYKKPPGNKKANTGRSSRPSGSKPATNGAAPKPATVKQLKKIEQMAQRLDPAQAVLDEISAGLKKPQTTATASAMITKLSSAPKDPKPTQPDPGPPDDFNQEPDQKPEAEASQEQQDPGLGDEINMLIMTYAQTLGYKDANKAERTLRGVLMKKLDIDLAELTMDQIKELHKEIEDTDDISPFKDDPE